MNIRPLYDRVVANASTNRKPNAMAFSFPIRLRKWHDGEVMAVKKGARLEDGTIVALDVQVGDRILFGRVFPATRSSWKPPSTSVCAQERRLGVPLDTTAPVLAKAS